MSVREQYEARQRPYARRERAHGRRATRCAAVAALGFVALVALLASCGAASPGEASPTLQYGTITGKGYDPPGREVQCTGAMHRPGSCRKVDEPECWRLDLRMWLVLPVSACVPSPRWHQVSVGDWWGGT